MNTKPRLSAVIITLNEEKRLRECLKSVSFADEIIVVDSHSTDKTEAVAREFPVRFLTRSFDNFSSQKNFALEQAGGDWILLIDADERVSTELRSEITASLLTAAKDRVYRIKRETWFFGKPLRHSGTKEDAPIRFFPKGTVRYVQLIHEEIETALPAAFLKSKLYHHTTENMSQFNQKLGLYMELEIRTLRESKKNVSFLDVILRPPARFLQRLFLQAGILDGVTGLQFAVLSGYYEFKKWGGYLKEVNS